MPEQPIEWYDIREDTNSRKIYTQQEHQIPSLRMFGYQKMSHAIPGMAIHYHKDCFEFVYIVHGNIRFSVDHHSYSLSGGDLFITYPNELHDSDNFPMSVHEMYWFQLEANNPHCFLFIQPEIAEQILDRLKNLSSRVFKVKQSIAPLLSEVFNLIASDDELSRVQAGIQLASLLVEIIRDSEQSSFSITPDIGRTMEYILDHLNERIEMEQLAKIALLSVSRFKQKFRIQSGMGPRDFINYYKIDAGKRLLAEGKSVTETAMELSFSSSTYFSAVFSKYTNKTPTEFVKSIRRENTMEQLEKR